MKHTLLMVGGLLAALTVAAAEGDDEAAQRAQIAQARAQAEQQYLAAERQCYQRFAVTDCLDEAKRGRRKALGQLHRQEAALNAARRQRDGEARREAIAQRSTPEKQRAAAEGQAQAAAATDARQARHADKQAARAPASEPPASAAARPQANRQATTSQGDGLSAQQRKLQEADERRAALARRLAERHKAPAAPLPRPD